MKNLFGKTLVVLIFTFSLALMTMSGAIYMTHNNWRLRAENVEKEVQAATAKLEGDGSKTGLRTQYVALQKSIDDEEQLRTRIAEALESEVSSRRAEYDSYQETVKKQDKDIRAQLNEMTRYTLALLKMRIVADDTLVKIQNERNERIRSVHEYVRNMNQIEDLTQQIQTLEKRARSLTDSQSRR